MFKGKIHLYRNVDGKKEELSREFDSEKDFQAFLDKSPELKKFRDTEWSTPRWPVLSDFSQLFENFERLGKDDLLGDLEKDLNSLFERSKKLLK